MSTERDRESLIFTSSVAHFATLEKSDPGPALNQPRGLSRPQRHRCRRVLKKGCPALVELVREGRLSVRAAAALTWLPQHQQAAILTHYGDDVKGLRRECNRLRRAREMFTAEKRREKAFWPTETAGMRAGVIDRALTWKQVLKRRLFPGRADLPPEWRAYYWRRVGTRVLGDRQMQHTCRFRTRRQGGMASLASPCWPQSCMPTQARACHPAGK